MEASHLIAFFIPVLLFTYWTTCGYAALCVLRMNPIMQNILLAPIFGISITLLPLFWLSRLGLPVEQFALSLTLILLLISLFILFKKRPYFPYKKYAPFIIIFILACSLTGHPLLHYGFNWISYGNNDMANYCLRALRFLHHGYSELPTNELIAGQDYSLSYWFLDNFTMERAGSDLLLAWISALTQMNPIQLFMPLIMTFLLVLLSGTGAILYHSKKDYSATFTAVSLLAFSALISLSVLYQLLSQTLGIGVFLGTSTVLLRPIMVRNRNQFIRQSILIGILFSALLLIYPEMLPFLGCSVLLYYLLKGFGDFKLSIIYPAAGIVIVTVFCVNVNLINVFCFLKIQLTYGFQYNFGNLFPYFLSINGFPYLWGFKILTERSSTVLLYLSIVLYIFCLISTFYYAYKKLPVAIILLVMSSLSLFFIKQHSGFSLFKLAMYSQPFLISVFVVGFFNLVRSFRIRTTCTVILAYLFSITQAHYIHFSKGSPGMPFVELPMASKLYLVDNISQFSASLNDSEYIIVDTSNILIAKLFSLLLRHHSILFPSKDFFTSTVIRNAIEEEYKAFGFNKKFMTNHVVKSGIAIKNDLDKTTSEIYFHLPHSLPSHKNIAFIQAQQKWKSNTHLILLGPNYSIINRSHFIHTEIQNFKPLAYHNAINYLIFINTLQSQDHTLAFINKNIGLYTLEADYFYPAHPFAAIGRYLLFQIIHPTNKCRIELVITNTLGVNRALPLTHASIVGAKRVKLPLTGYGSARIFSEPLTPQMLNSSAYIVLDMNTPLKDLNATALDPRYISSYSRNISIISEEEYQHLQTPSLLTHFPEDLLSTRVEYSGLYEDGYISNRSYIYLKKPPNKSHFIINGLYPQMVDHQDNTTLKIFIDNNKIQEITLSPGYFNIILSSALFNTRSKIIFIFSKQYMLSKQDRRPVAAKINKIGFE